MTPNSARHETEADPTFMTTVHNDAPKTSPEQQLPAFASARRSYATADGLELQRERLQRMF